MNSKIQEMIQMALEDGVITENEKKSILKKAVELGEDTDMVDLAIECLRCCNGCSSLFLYPKRQKGFKYS